MKETSLLYDYPRLYELAFSFRDIGGEAAVMQECIGRFASIPVRRVLELGCGPAPHAGELTRMGLRVVGLDNNHAMLDYARSRWADLVPRPEFLHGDMTCFRLEEPVEFVFVMLGSLYADSVGELTTHLDSVAGTLRPGGLYFLDGCIQFCDPLAQADVSCLVEQGGVRIESSFDIALLDAEEQLYEETWTVVAEEHGQTRRFRTVERNRALAPQEFLELIGDHPAFEFVGWWQDWDLKRPLEPGMESLRPLAVVRRVMP